MDTLSPLPKVVVREPLKYSPEIHVSTDKDPVPFEAEYFKPWIYHPTSMYWWSTRYYASLVKQYKSGGRLLDLGCGLGHLLNMFDERFETFGIDISEYALARAHENAPRAHLMIGGAQDLALPSNSFDVLVMKHVIEHLPEPACALQQLARLLRPGGILILGTPNPANSLRRLKGDDWYGLKDKTHISVKSPKEWGELASAQGLRVVKMIGDGLWDVPYLPLLPTALQRVLFGAPAAFQVITRQTWMPVSLGESLIMVARK